MQSVDFASKCVMLPVSRASSVPQQAAHYITAKIGDAGVPRHVK